MSASVVSPVSAIVLSHRVLLRQLVTWSRVLALLFIGQPVAVVAGVVGASSEIDDPVEAGVRVMSDLGLAVLVPVVALVFASAALGDTREDGTLVYLWLRPMNRWPVVLGAWLAAVTVSLPLTVVPLGVSAVLVDGGDELVTATILASVVGVLAYSAVFVLLGLLPKNPVVWGLGYIIIWEGVVAAFGTFAARLAIRGYTRSIITARTGIDLDLGDLSQAAGITVPLVVAVVALVLASVRLSHLDVA